ncbi:MAG: hypothetical protein DLM61_12735 [Pseudonocardiales bacterium]|nr:MAG: hypothetical protein DLM61_12735 [Pseudonocardiales bacterium]
MVTTNTPTTTSTTDEQIRAAACHMYDAECALHIAHQSHVDSWIMAASLKLHEAITEHLAAIANQHPDAPRRATPSTAEAGTGHRRTHR